MANAFKVGDVVELKSGSPDMTVTELKDNGDLVCRWFAGGKAQEDVFPPDAVKSGIGSDNRPLI
jgi:uncharacterized protein YodC (DUF2158 family)